MGIAATSGHGVKIAIEPWANPIVSGVFTAVAELTGDVGWPTWNRNKTDTTSHDGDIDTYVTGPLKRQPKAWDLNFVYNSPTHDHLTGFYKHQAMGSFFGVRIWDAGGSALHQEWILSGFVENIDRVSQMQGVKKATITFQPSGPQIIDGVTIGTSS